LELPAPPPAAELARRLTAFQTALSERGLDGALIVQPADLVYLSGTAQNAHLAVPAAGEPVLLVRRDVARARAESALERVEELRSLRDLPEALASVGLRGRVRLGLELDVLPAASYLRFAGLFEEAELVDAMPALWQARSVKSDWELERIAAACEQTRAAIEAVPALLVPGRAEVDVLSELAHLMRLAGHEGTLRFRGLGGDFFFGQVLAGASAAVPSPTETPLGGPGLSSAQGRGPGRRTLRDGDAVVVDLSGLSEGYVSDQTRTFFIGEPSGALLAAYATCRAILAECVALLRSGMLASAVYERGAELATQAGYGDNFMGDGPARVRFVGHCIGLELNEPPYLAQRWDEPLRAGNVVAVEPKLVFAGVGAVGVENSYLVTDDGPRQLTFGSEEPITVPA
jgi:Xaa-Pro dipeptidase